MQASISFNQSHKSNLAHNNRDNVHGNPDIDQSRLDQNIYFVQKDIREVYEEVFQEAVDSYNAKQSRNDRKIENYFDKVRNDNKTHEQRELIVAIGDGKDGEEYRSLKKSALVEYAKEFQERNPNLAVYNMVLHDDEANPHLHINYVPNFESKRGLTRRVGMDKALQQQGVEGKGTELIGKWRASETGRIEDLAKEHIPGFERANVGSHKYMKVQEYKEYAETLNTVQKEVENQKADLESIDEIIKIEKGKLSELEEQKSDLADEVRNRNFERKRLQRDVSRLENNVQNKEIELQRSTERLDQLKKEVSKIESPIVELESIKPKKFFNQVTVHEKEYETLMNMAKKSLDDNKTGLELERENNGLKKQVTQYQKIEKEQDRKLNVLEQQKERHRVESLRLNRENQKLLQERNIFKRLYEVLKDWMKSKGLNIDFEKYEKTIEREEKQRDRQMEMER